MPGPRRLAPRPVLLAALAALAAAACSPSFPLPPGAQVTCGSDADCPGGTVCRATLGRCVQPGGDVTAPQLVASSLVVTPERVGAATAVVRVEFDVTEALATDPQASLRLSGAGAPTRPLAVVSRDDLTHHYVLSYVPAPGSDSEGDVTFLARFVDAAGNEGRVELPRVAVLDFTKPALAIGAGGLPMSAVALTPPATSPLRAVSAATAGTRLRVDFAAAEPLLGGADAPVVTLGTGGAALTLAQVSGNGLSFVYEGDVPAGFPEGPAVPLSAHLLDLARNAADVSLGTVQVTTHPPASPAVGTAGAILFHRVPWGSEATGGAEAYFLRGLAGAVEPGCVVVAYSDPTVVTSAGALVGREIARVAADGATGAFGGDVGDPSPFPLYMGDAPDLYVAAVDAAGNVSDADGDPSNGVQAALVRDVAWTATMNGKIPGRVFPNPHTFEGRRVWTETLAQRDSTSVPAPADVGRRDGVRASVRGAPWWSPVRTYRPLADRGGTGIVHDPVRGCRVAFGGVGWDGCDQGSYCTQWESCRGSTWRIPAVADPEGDGNPSRNSDLPVVFAGGRGTTVLSDGTDLWEWDGASWRKLAMADPEGDGDPSPRREHAIAYDEARQRLVLFGGVGQAGGALLGDTWESDFRSWKRVCAAAPCSASDPAPRSGHAMVYDPLRKATLLVGGRISSTPTYDASTWIWNGTAWTATCTAAPCLTSSPAQRESAGLAFDPRLGKAVLYGGRTASGYDGGTFEWDGVTWARRCTGAPCTTSKPMARARPSVFHDPDRLRTVLYGGEVAYGSMGEECFGPFCGTEWEWDGSMWTSVEPLPASPPSVTGVTPVYDPVRDRIVLFGGETASGASSSATWLWDGSRWAAATPTRVPPGRSSYGAAWVQTGSSAGYVAIADGADGTTPLASTATWDGVNWTTQLGAPSARTGATMAQSPRTTVATGALLFGGRDAGYTALCDTWELWAGTWTRLLNPTCAATAGPPARFGHAMVRATGFTNRPVLLFGGLAGSDTSNDLWSYYAGTWTRLSAGGSPGATQPAPRVGSGLLFDPGRNRVLLWGGNIGPAVSIVDCVDYYGGPSCHDFWEWSGAEWTRVFPADVHGDGSPDPSLLSGLAYDTSSRQAGLGIEATPGTLTTWWWNGGASDQPGEVMTVVFDAAEVRRAFDVLDLGVTWVGGASGAPGGVVTPGASVQLWDNRAWRPLVSSLTASPGAPEPLQWSLGTDPVLSATPIPERRRFMVGDQRLLHFALVPNAPSGRAAGMGEASTDYAEVTVRYRLAPP